MPKYNNPTDEEMYSDAAPAEAEAPAEGGGEDYGGQTAVIPKALLAGKEFKPGDEVVFKIVSMQDDSVVVEYATEGGGDSEAEEAANSESPELAGPAPTPDEMSSMME